MKKRTIIQSPFLPTLLILFFAISGFSQTNEAVDYFDFLNQKHNDIVRQNLEFTQYSVHSDDLLLVEKMRKDLIDAIRATQLAVKKRMAFEGGIDMRNELVKVLGIYRESFQYDFDKISILKQKSKDSYEALEAYFASEDALEEKLEAAANQFLLAQKEYAPLHNIKLSAADENQVIKQINEVNEYTRTIYMKEFRVSKANAIFFDALESEDVDAMEKARKKLVVIAREELDAIKKIGAFKNDSRFPDAAKILITYYLNLAKNEYNDLIGITNKANEVGLNQRDADAFNKIVRDFNENSGALVDKFYETMNFLLKNNVPKPEAATQRL